MAENQILQLWSLLVATLQIGCFDNFNEMFDLSIKQLGLEISNKKLTNFKIGDIFITDFQALQELQKLYNYCVIQWLLQLGQGVHIKAQIKAKWMYFKFINYGFLCGMSGVSANIWQDTFQKWSIFTFWNFGRACISENTAEWRTEILANLIYFKQVIYFQRY